MLTGSHIVKFKSPATEDYSITTTVEPRSIVPVTIVFPHVPFAIFGPK
jgi:hypothetical protein